MPFSPGSACGNSSCSEIVAPGSGGFCPAHSQARDKQDRQARGTSTQRGYNARHRKWRKLVLARDPLCRVCYGSDCVRPATVADHIMPLDPNDPSAGDWSMGNGQGLCAPCHNEKTAGEKLGGHIPTSPVVGSRLIIVCGPPLAGKNDYIRRNMKLGDTVHDLEIETHGAGVRMSVAFKSTARGIWVMIGAPHQAQRNAMRQGMLPGKVVVLETPATVCKRRAQGDPRGAQILAAAIDQWWRAYSRDDRDVAVLPPPGEAPVYGS
jgi:5-methylcytosine-specific restriction protein A